MSKPDFFLPFHLPEIFDDKHFANIKYEGLLLDGDRNYIKDCPIDKDMIQKARLKTGVYQTMTPKSLWTSQTFFLSPFSISLN